ncbi:MAG: right-handed parallel beta-helix repeat-containing protein [Acidobacteria bacterium]|nr:right-handed parallel beta-helix repeat-containing protein [Acidobacteriota bacterium]
MVPGGTIATDTTWTAAGAPYIVTGDVIVQGTDGADGVTTLTIQPGVQVRFQLNAGLIIGAPSGAPGALIADGTVGPGAPATIAFTSDSASPTPGIWEGIVLRATAHASTVLRRASVTWAGAGANSGALYAAHGAATTITVDNVQFQSSGTYDVFLASGALAISNSTLQSFFYNTSVPRATWTGNTFQNWGQRKSRCGINDVKRVVSGNTFVPVPGAVLQVLSDTGASLLSEDATWTTNAGPYELVSDLLIYGTDGADGVTTLTLNPGVELRFPTASRLYVGGVNAGQNPGALVADGTVGPGAPARVLFTSTAASPTPGAWIGIELRNRAHASTRIKHAQIAYAGVAGTGVIALGADPANPLAIDDTLFTNSGSYDLYLTTGRLTVSNSTLQSFYYASSAARLTWTNNTFQNWGQRKSRCGINDVKGVVSGNTFLPVSGAVLQVLSDTGANLLSEDATWTTNAGPYELVSDLYIYGTDGADGVTTLTLNPGVELRFPAASRLYIGGLNAGQSPGALVADGTLGPGAPARVLFTSSATSPVPGAWIGIELRNRALSSTRIKHVQIAYAGVAGSGAILMGADPSNPLAIDDVLFPNAGSYDLYLNSGRLAVSNSTMQSFYYASSVPRVTWTNNTFQNWGQRKSRCGINDVKSVVSGNAFLPVSGAVLQVLSDTGFNLLSEDATWTTSAGPYELVSDLYIYGTDGADGVTTLTLNPGVELRFPAASRLYVGGVNAGQNPGALVADGTVGPGAPARVLFTSTAGNPTPGAWIGIELRNRTLSSTRIKHVQIAYAGVAGTGAIAMGGDPANPLAIDDVLFPNAGSYDLYLNSGLLAVSNSTLQSFYYASSVPRVTWTNNTFQNWGQRKSRCGINDVKRVVSGNSFQPVAGAVLQVLSDTGANLLSEDATWTTNAGPYELVSDLYIYGTDGADGVTTLTLDPGVELRFPAASRLYIGGVNAGQNPGALVADGTVGPGAPDRILFTSSAPSPAPGAWVGIELRNRTMPSTRFKHVEFAYGGVGGSTGVVSANSDLANTLTIDDALFTSSGNFDIYATQGRLNVLNSTLRSLYYSSNLPRVTWEGNTFENWGARTSRVSTADVPELSHGNTFNPVTGAFVEVLADLAGAVAVPASWGPEPGPYHPTGDLFIHGTAGNPAVLTLEPGVTLRFASGRRLYVGGGTAATPGELVADGTVGGGAWTINLTSAQPVPNVADWNGILVRTGGRATLRHVQASWVGTGLEASATLGPVEDVVVNRANVGFDLKSGAVFEQMLTGLTFRNCGIGLRASAVAPVVRNSSLVGTTFAVQNLSPASTCVDARNNWWGAVDGPSGAPPVSGCNTATPGGSGSKISDGVLFSPWRSEPADDGDPTPLDDGDGVVDPCTGGQTTDCDDNCPLVSNPSQKDADGDAVGDACDSNPVLRVSTDPLDDPDFAVVQDAVDAAFQSGTRIEICPGLTPPYHESVRVDRLQVFSFVGIPGASNPGPARIDGGAGPAFLVLNKVGTVPVLFNNLVLSGAQGIKAQVDTDVRDMGFESIAGAGLDIDAGSHALTRSTFDDTVQTGVDVAAGATVAVTRTTMRGQSNAGLLVAGTAQATNVTILDGLGGSDGVRLVGGGTATIRYATIANNTGSGIDNTQGGTVTLDRSVVYGNSALDLVNVACGAVSWSAVGSPNCSAVNQNLSADPQLDAEGRLGASSPCLDHGPDPALYDGNPPSDLDGGPRLVDHDGDGSARNDCGAYERVNPLTPGEVLNVRFSAPTTMLWDPVPTAVQYHLYVGTPATLSYQNYGSCQDVLDPNRSDTQFADAATPAPGTGRSYIVTAEDAGGSEGTMGYGTSAERSNYSPCP